MPYGKYVNMEPATAPAQYPNSVVVGGNGKPLSTQTSSNASSLQKIIDSGVPLTGGTSASEVNNTAVNIGQALGSLGSNLTTNFSNLFDLIKQNTQYNNAWSAEQAQKQMDFQTQANQIAMDFNAAEAAKNRDWQEMMSNTAHQREMADLKAAGLNPVLTASGGNGAAVTSGSAASGVTSSGAQADADQSANTALAAIYGSIINAQTQMFNANLSAQTNLKMAQLQQETQMYGSQLAAEASKYGAGVNAAAMQYSAEQAALASKYASDNQVKINEANNQWKKENPQTNAGIVSNIKQEIENSPAYKFGENLKSGVEEYLNTYYDPPPWLKNLFG